MDRLSMVIIAYLICGGGFANLLAATCLQIWKSVGDNFKITASTAVG